MARNRTRPNFPNTNPHTPKGGGAGSCQNLRSARTGYAASPTDTGQFYLSTLLEHTMFEAEAVCLVLGAYLLSKESQVSSATISTDSQTALSSLDIHKPRPGQQYMDEFLCLTGLIWHQATQDDYHLALTWVKGHNRVDGNARANEVARDAAKGSSSPEMELPESLHAGPLPTSVAAL